MFQFDTFTKNAHDLSLAATLGNNSSAGSEPKPEAARSGATRRLVLALAVAASIVVWLAWAVLS